MHSQCKKTKDFQIKWTVGIMIGLACVSVCAMYALKDNSVDLAFFVFSTVSISLFCRVVFPRSKNGFIRVGRCLADVGAVVLVISEFAKIPGTAELPVYIWTAIFIVIFFFQAILMKREFS